MAILCMLYGQSGTGKSTSLRNFQKEDVSIINVSGKPMPFRQKLADSQHGQLQADYRRTSENQNTEHRDRRRDLPHG